MKVQEKIDELWNELEKLKQLGYKYPDLEIVDIHFMSKSANQKCTKYQFYFAGNSYYVSVKTDDEVYANPTRQHVLDLDLAYYSNEYVIEPKDLNELRQIIIDWEIPVNLVNEIMEEVKKKVEKSNKLKAIETQIYKLKQKL